MKELELSDGNRIPVLGLGTWELLGDECKEAIRMALNLGYRHIDTAEIYGNQKEIGIAIKKFDRKKIFITSKVWRENLHYDNVIKSCNETLKDLQTDYLDLYLIHWPNRNIPLKETFKALEKLVDEGKIKSIGVSNFTINHLKDALKVAKLPIIVNQIEFHPYLYQRDLLEFCNKNKIVITAYSPLGRGRLLSDKTILKIANKHEKTPAQICLRWELEKGIVVIPKASSEKHLKENMDIFDWKLDKEDINEIDSIGVQKRFVNPNFSEFDY